MINNRRGMGVAQVFIFILAAVSFSLIMIFGYRAINGFLSSGNEVQLVQFRTDLDGSIKKIYTEYGSVREQRYKLPSGFEKICFVNLESKASPSEIDALKKENLAAGMALEESSQAQREYEWSYGEKDGYDSVDENVFLSPSQQGLTQIKVYHISIGNVSNENADYSYACVPVREGSFSLILEGKGDRTKIYPVYQLS